MAKTRYKTEFDRIAKAMTELGATYPEVAEALDVSIVTLHKFRHNQPSFNRAFALGQKSANDRVEQSLYSRAVGYDRETLKIFAYEGAAIEHSYTEHVLPDVRAQQLWLENRSSDRWRQNDGLLKDEDGIPIGYNAILRVIVDPQTGKPEETDKDV